MDMGTQGSGRKRLPNRERLTAEDDALNQIAREVSQARPQLSASPAVPSCPRGPQRPRSGLGPKCAGPRLSSTACGPLRARHTPVALLPSAPDPGPCGLLAPGTD